MEEGGVRPTIRGDCLTGLRPCPWVGCRYHLLPHLLSIHHHTDEEVISHLLSMEDTCVLDIIDRDPGASSVGDAAYHLHCTAYNVEMTQQRAEWKLARLLKP